MTDLLRNLLKPAPVQPIASLRAWWERHRSEASGLRPIDRAVLGGATADRVGYAFAAGYQAALRALVSSLPDHALVSLCVTEAGGTSPRAIQTTLTPEADGHLRLHGHKTFATLAPESEILLVVASTGVDADGRSRLAVACVPASAPGVTPTRLPETHFVPELPHAEIALHAVQLDEGAVLPGDGYDRYVKPFRTVEDIHVYAAVLAYVLGIATRFKWPRPVREQLLFVIAGLRALAAEPPDAPETHVALGGAFSQARAVLDGASALWERVELEIRSRWERDLPLLNVAERNRVQRLARAWERLAGSQSQ